MIVCHCFAVNDRRVRSAVADGAQTVEDVAEMEDAGGLCGGCHYAICQLLKPHQSGGCGGDDCAVPVTSSENPQQVTPLAPRRQFLEAG